ncbi:MAG: DUF1080 domain-containing protein [Myxococcota bacterium]|nr:DUF1080 domain-containing protein [Deltaproteobacteria bacterium]MDQ3336675.1 DUF1080 domain-containing protein [Myxococcota bacterium]
MTACADLSDEQPTFSDGGADTPAVAGTMYQWTFDDETPGPMAAPWFDVLGDWQVEDGAAVQSARHENAAYPRALVEDLQFTDLKMSVKCRMESGDTDRACGIMFRAVDSDNYYITRANTLEDNIRLYRVVGGGRAQFASVERPVDSDRWYTLEIEATENRIVVSWDGEPIIDTTDDTFANGAIGLWTKADSITRFDDVTAIAR